MRQAVDVNRGMQDPGQTDAVFQAVSGELRFPEEPQRTAFDEPRDRSEWTVWSIQLERECGIVSRPREAVVAAEGVQQQDGRTQRRAVGQDLVVAVLGKRRPVADARGVARSQ